MRFGGKVVAFGAGLLVMAFVMGAVMALGDMAEVSIPYAVHMAHIHAGALALACLAYGAALDRTRLSDRWKCAGGWLAMAGSLIVPGAFLLKMAAEPLVHMVPLGTLLMAMALVILARGALLSGSGE